MDAIPPGEEPDDPKRLGTASCGFRGREQECTARAVLAQVDADAREIAAALGDAGKRCR